MDYKVVGTITIDYEVTTIRLYDNGFYVVEVNGDVKYSGETWEDLKSKLYKNNMSYNFFE